MENEIEIIYDTRDNLNEMARNKKKSCCRLEVVIPMIVLMLLNAFLAAAVLSQVVYFELNKGNTFSESSTSFESKSNVNYSEDIKLQEISQMYGNLTKMLKDTQTSLKALEEAVMTINDTHNMNSQHILSMMKGMSSQYPVPSCSSLPPHFPSKYYWILSSNGSSILAYCDMTRTCGNITGGWTRVAQLDMKDRGSQCPQDLCLNTTLPRTCRICNFTGACSSDVFQVHFNYTQVCGRIIGYQIGTTDAFSTRFSNGFDGVDLSYGNETIWTFAAAFNEFYVNSDVVCPCINPWDTNIPQPPNRIGNNYFCDTGARQRRGINGATFFSSNPLWDGTGCESPNVCCVFNNPPWFYRKLSSSSISEPIKMRVCHNYNPLTLDESIGIETIDLYVQ